MFRRGGAPRAEREWDVVAVDDPHGFANVNRIVQWRRVMPTGWHQAPGLLAGSPLASLAER